MNHEQTLQARSTWAKAKKLCRLSVEDIRKAKQLGFSPKALMKNIPAPSQKWKLPVKLWIAGLHEKRFGRERSPGLPSGSSPQALGPSAPGQEPDYEVDVPF